MSRDVPREERVILPVPPPNRPAPSAVDIREQSPPFAPVGEVKAPDGAPNVVVILLDDCGFAASSPFGGPVDCPAAERLAEGGLRYTRFHTTAVCSSTRAALLTGRNHHSVGMGHVTNLVTPAPGYDGRMPASAATIARTLTCNGYATGAFGKMHQTPLDDITPIGPYETWPTGREGFEKFYGFFGGEVSQWYPVMYEDTAPVEPPKTPAEGYHLSEDIVDRAIGWIRDVRSLNEDKPFFCYLPFGATHAPFHVHREWIEKYKGAFDHGWDRQREITLERQKQLGIVPDETELAPWASSLPHWDEMSEAEQRATAALMENYAGFLEHTDAQVGRFVDALEADGCLEDTMIVYILGDNGASAEGGPLGTPNEYLHWNGVEVTAEMILEQADELGGENSWPNYSAGWALAMDTPFQWFKQVASHYGGTRNGMIVHWPNGIEEGGGLREQFHHVIDIAPTILEVAGLPVPRVVDGAEQQPIEGTALTYSLNDPQAAERHTVQYFEMGGSRGIYQDGWVACTPHRPDPWRYFGDMPSFESDAWELYDTLADPSQSRDLAAEHPERLERLKELFVIEAARYQVLPLEDRPIALRRYESGFEAKQSMTFHARSRRIGTDAVPNIVGTSFTITAELTVGEDETAEGVLCAQGGKFSGWSLYCRDGHPTFCVSLGDGKPMFVRAESAVPTGTHEVRFEFDYDGGGLTKGGTGRFFVDEVTTGEGRIAQTVGTWFQLSEEFNVGIDPSTAVSPDYRQWDNEFNGTIAWLRIDLDPEGESVDHRAAREMASQ